MARKNSETVPATEVTDVKVTADTVETLAARYIQTQNTIDKFDSVKKWEWSRDLSLMLDCTADKKARTIASEALGRLIGEGLGRGAYSGSWVRQHCNAYKKFEQGMSTQEDYRAFLAAVNGHMGPSRNPSEKAEKAETSDTDSDGEIANDYLGKIRSAVKRALKAGISVADITDAVRDALSS